MSLILYYHPLSSFCHKVLIALYENDIPFEKHCVDLGNIESRAEFLKMWPIGKFPVLRDTARDWLVPESSIIIEYLEQHFPGKTKFFPQDRERRRQMRMCDRFYDLHVHAPMQKIVGDKIRPAGKTDPFGVEQAWSQLHTALKMIEQDMPAKTWAMGDAFTLADCAAAPPLWFINQMAPLASTYPAVATYLQRLTERPAFARALKEAEPYLHLFPR